ncbi:hypothetical protein PRIC2_013171 [Phytophthora ramorum]
MRVLASVFTLAGLLVPSSALTELSNESNGDVQQPLLDATDWFLTEQDITNSRGGVPRSDMAVYTTGNAVTAYTVTKEFYDAVYDDLIKTKEGDRVMLTGWTTALVPLKPDVDPTGATTGVDKVFAGVVKRGKLPRDFRIRKLQEMTGLSYGKLGAMTFIEAADQLSDAADDKSTILETLDIEYHAYFIAITDTLRKVSDPEDTCTYR